MDRFERIERLIDILNSVLEDYATVRVEISAETDDGRYPNRNAESFEMSFVISGEGAVDLEDEDE